MAKKCIQKTEDCQSTLTRSSDYRDKTPNPKGPGDWRSHHILCCMAVKTINVKPEHLHFVEDCLWVSKWNINDPDNLMSLPTKQQHRDEKGLIPANKCAHNVDHPSYNADVCEWLRKNVWSKVEMQQAPHTVDPHSIAQQLKDCTNAFKTFLAFYGTRLNGKGTAGSWADRFSNPDTWYQPFSMAAEPSPRHVGSNDATMSRLFEKLTVG